MRGDVDSQHPHLVILEFHLPVVAVYLYGVLSLAGCDGKAHHAYQEQYSTHGISLLLSRCVGALELVGRNVLRG